MFDKLRKKQHPSLSEIIDIEELKPDVATVMRAKKRLTSMEATEVKYIQRKNELEAELNEALATVEVQVFGFGFDGIVAELSKVFDAKPKRAVTTIKSELSLLEKWYRGKLGADITTLVSEDIEPLITDQRKKLVYIETAYETKTNTHEIDSFVPVIHGELGELIQRTKALGDHVTATDSYIRTARNNPVFRDSAGKYFGYPTPTEDEIFCYYAGGASAYMGTSWNTLPQRNKVAN